jgi:two-component system OmpR family response regulator
MTMRGFIAPWRTLMNNLRILVVDDDPVTRALLQKRLTKEAYEVATADDGVTAVERIANEFYDVILTDLMMPGGVDGIAVLETAKKKNIRTEVILITAHASLDNAIEAMKKGAADYLQKPINLDELIMRLQKIGNLKMLLKNACDLRDAMDATEQASAQTIQTLELAVAELEGRLAEIKSILTQEDAPLKERIALAKEKC